MPRLLTQATRLEIDHRRRHRHFVSLISFAAVAADVAGDGEIELFVVVLVVGSVFVEVPPVVALILTFVAFLFVAVVDDATNDVDSIQMRVVCPCEL